METFRAFPLNASTRGASYAFWRNGLSLEELEKVDALGLANVVAAAQVGTGTGGAVRIKTRDCSVSWIPPNADSDWLFQKITQIMAALNHDYFGFDLWGFLDGLQYTVYDARDGTPEFYSWHTDMTGKGRMTRKLSFVLQLSDPMDYEGGDLKIQGMTSEVLVKERGIIHTFPSYMLHQVTPVTHGVRKSLVAWAVGPDFR